LNVSNPHYWDGKELVGITGEDHYEWAVTNTPFFECSDEDITKAYYFRWYSYHNHINYTSPLDVVTEFYPKVSWASTYNTIPCAAGHHIHEGRWLRDEQVVDQYLEFWFYGGGSPEYYTFWAAHSTLAHYRVTGNATLVQHIFPALVNKNYWTFLNENYNEEYGCFWHPSDREGQENSVGGDGCRPVSNSVMFGEADSLRQMAAMLGNTTAAKTFAEEAVFWREVVTEKLWSKELGFFVTLTVPKPSKPTPAPSPVPVPTDYTVFANNSFCCDQVPCKNGHSSFLYEGGLGAQVVAAAVVVVAVAAVVTTTTAAAAVAMAVQVKTTTVWGPNWHL
jgi:hypothetical protein